MSFLRRLSVDTLVPIAVSAGCVAGPDKTRRFGPLGWKGVRLGIYMGVSKNNGTPKSSHV